MGKVIAGITTSIDGYVTGPDDGPGRGLGIGGERLHYWVFGGPWTYDEEPTGAATGEDRAWLESAMANLGAVISGRWTYEAADHWGGRSPWPVPFFVLTHKPEEQPEPEAGFTFVDNLEGALALAQEAAGDKDVHVMGGGKQLFDGFDQRVDLEHLGVRQSQWATFVDYRVVRPG